MGLGVPGSVRWGPPAQGTHSWHPSAREVLGSGTQALSCGRRSGRGWQSGSRTLALPAVEGIGAARHPGASSVLGWTSRCGSIVCICFLVGTRGVRQEAVYSSAPVHA